MQTRNLLVTALAFVFATTGLISSAYASSPGNGEVVPVAAKRLFAPIGFDDNDEATVVVDGFLPSGCYRLVAPEVVVNQVTKQITITPKARYFDQPCVEALIPFWQEVRLGILSIGDYKVDLPFSTIQETMSVSEATTAGPDDFLYAAIDNALVDKPDDSDQYFIKLQGRFTNSCMILQEIRVINTGATTNVLPIMVMENRGNECLPVEVPFRRMVALPDSVTEGRHLLHVRSLNGQAVNHMFTKIGN